jgi:ferric-dicitrate binding protein FerR (iron transport regulator)
MPEYRLSCQNLWRRFTNALRNTVTVIAAVSVLGLGNICSAHKSTTAEDSRKSNHRQMTGMATVTGVASINDAPAISGQTLFSGSKVLTSPDSNLILDVAGATRLNIAEQSEVWLEFAPATLFASLRNGTITSAVPPGVTLRIDSCSNFSVVSDATNASQFTVDVNGDDLSVSVTSGIVEVQTGDQVRRLSAGSSFSTNPQSSPQNNLSGGKRAAIFGLLGAAIAVVFIAVIGNSDVDPGGPGGCITVPSGTSPQNPC